MAHHFGRLGYAFDLLDRGQLDELLVGPGRRVAERTDAFGDDVERIPLLGVLAHEHQVQAVEVRTGDVPVEVVRHQVERIAVGEQGGKSLRDFLALAGADTDVDRRGFGFLGVHGRFSLVKKLAQGGIQHHHKRKAGHQGQRFISSKAKRKQ